MQCYEVTAENTDAAIDAVCQAAFTTGASNDGSSIDGISVAACLLAESTARLDAVKGITPPEARLKATDSSSANQARIRARIAAATPPLCEGTP